MKSFKKNVKNNLLSLLFGIGTMFASQSASAIIYNDVNSIYSSRFKSVPYELVENVEKKKSEEKPKKSNSNQKKLKQEESKPKSEPVSRPLITKIANIDSKIVEQNNDLPIEKNVSKITENMGVEYVVKPGDYLSKIAKDHNIDWFELAKVNKINKDEGYVIHPNQVLIIPTIDRKITLETKLELPIEKVVEKKSLSVIDSPKKEIKKGLIAIKSEDDCYKTSISFSRKTSLKEISRKTHLSQEQIKEQLDLDDKSKSLSAGVYDLCLYKDEKTGFIPFNPEENWKIILTKSGEEIWNDRKSMGVNGLAAILGMTPGNCIPSAEEKTEIIRNKYSLIEEKAAMYDNVLPEVLAAVMKIETGGNSKCISPTGALGSMGLTKHIYDPSRKWYDGSYKESINPFDDEVAIERSAELLSNLLKKYRGNYHYALSAYNQGEEKVDLAIASAKKHGIKNSYDVVSTNLPTLEGKNYSKKVLNLVKVIKKDRNELLAMNN